MSTVTFKTLEWDNCFSYGLGNKIDLTKSKVTQILGPNGYGKSSIPLILEELYFNKNFKGVKKKNIPNRVFDDGYRIAGTFSKDSDEYRVEVVRSKTINVKLFKNEKDISSHKSTDTYKQLLEILGADYKTLSQLISQNPKSSLEFLEATDTTRKKFLMNLFDMSEYIEKSNTFKEAWSIEKGVLQEYEGSLNTIKSWLDKNQIIADKREPKELPTKNFSDEDLIDLKAKLSNIEQRNAEISAKNLRIATNISYINQLNTLTDKPREKGPEAESDISGIRSAIAINKSKQQELEDQMDKTQELGNVCPTCDQEVDAEFKHNQLEDCRNLIVILKGEERRLTMEMSSAQRSNQVFNENKHLDSEIALLEAKIDRNLPASVEEILSPDELQSEIEEIESVARKFQSELQAVEKYNNEVASHNAVIDSLMGQKQEMEKDYEIANEKVKNQRALVGRLDTLKKAFSPNGLPAFKIENLIKDLEQLTNQYLSEFSEGRFILEFIMEGEKLNVIINDNGLETEIESLSSGELARVNTSALLAIRKLMNSISPNTVNLLFLDEVISVLDDEGKEKLIEVLLEEHDLNTFVVSHSWTHPLVDKLEVQKEDEISFVEYG